MLSEKFPLLERRLRRVQRFRLRPCARGLEVGGAVGFFDAGGFAFPGRFLKGSRSVASRLFARYPYMRNWVDARHEKSIAWLTFMGFKLGEPQPYGVYGMDFIPFSHSKEAV